MTIENYCAVIENGYVTALLVIDPSCDLLSKNKNWKFIGSNPDGVGIGWSYDGQSFIAPELEPEPYFAPIITKVAFRFRLTDAEYVGILAAAKTDVEVAAWVETFNMVTQVNLDDSRTESGLQMMVAKNLLTDERKAEILSIPVQGDERP